MQGNDSCWRGNNLSHPLEENDGSATGGLQEWIRYKTCACLRAWSRQAVSLPPHNR
ncbi:hypothetical protein BVIET440_100164 [Burkholderia vietnamiensis]